MRVTNFILHIITMILMLPDLVFVGINTFMGLGYLDGIELIMVPMIAMLFGLAFYTSTIGEIMMLISLYKKPVPKAYMRRELISHGLCALCFALAIIYMIKVALNSSAHDYGIGPFVNVAGLILSLVCIILNIIVGIRKKRKAAAIAKASASAPFAQSVSRPKFCPNCGKPTGEAGDFCGGCGAKLVR